MNGLASVSPHETDANTLFEHILFLVIPGGSCVYGCQLTHHLSIVAYGVKRLEGFIQLLDKGTSKFTLVLLIISSLCLLAFNQCLFKPYHLLYRLSHVFHLLDDNLSLTYAMNHWMVQSVHTNALHGSSKLQWLAHNH